MGYCGSILSADAFYLAVEFVAVPNIAVHGIYI